MNTSSILLGLALCLRDDEDVMARITWKIMVPEP